MDQDDLLVVVIAGCVVSAVLIAVALVVHCKVWSLESKANDLNTKYEFEMKERLLREAHLPPKKAYYPVAVAPMPPPQQLQLQLQQSPPVERDPVAESDRMWVELRALEQRQEAAEAARHRALKSAYAAKLASQSLGEHVEPRAKQLVTGTSTSAVEPQRRSEPPVQTYIPRVPNEALRRALLPPVPTRPPAPSAPPVTTPPTTRRSHTPSLPTVPVPQPPPPPPPTSRISAIADLTAPPLPVTTPPPPPAPPAAPTPPPQPDANAFFGGSGGGALADPVDYSDDEDASATTPAPTQRTSSMKNQQMLEKMHTYFDKDTKGELEHSSSFVLHSAARKWQDKAAKRAGSHPTPAPTAMKEIQDSRAVNMVSDVQNPIKEQDNVLVQAKQVEERMERERRAAEEQAAAEVEAKEAALAAARKKKEDEERAAEQAAKRAAAGGVRSDNEIEQARQAELDMERRMEEKRRKMRESSEARLAAAQEERERRKAQAEEDRRRKQQEEEERVAREVAQKAEAERKAKEKEEREREEMMANMNPTQRRMFLEHQAQLEKEKEFQAKHYGPS